jgi:hypothetical protein
MVYSLGRVIHLPYATQEDRDKAFNTLKGLAK